MKSRSSERFCKHCKTWKKYQGFKRHEQACAKFAALPEGWLEREYLKGRSTTAIGASINISRQTVAEKLVGLGVELRHRGAQKVKHPRKKKITLARRDLARDPSATWCSKPCEWIGCDPNAEKPLPCEAPLVRAQLDGDEFSELEYWIMRGWVKMPRNGSTVT